MFVLLQEEPMLALSLWPAPRDPQQGCYGLGSHLWDWPFIKNQDFFQGIIMKFKSILSLYLYMYDYQYFQISGLTFIIDVDVLCCKNFSPISSPVPCSANSPCSPGRLQTRHPVRWTVAHLPQKLLPARLKTLPSENPWEDEEMLLIPSLLPNNWACDMASTTGPISTNPVIISWRESNSDKKDIAEKHREKYSVLPCGYYLRGSLPPEQLHRPSCVLDSVSSSLHQGTTGTFHTNSHQTLQL